MIGATAVSMKADSLTTALIPLAVGLLAAFVAWGRWRVAPLCPPVSR
jgi:hypothetical protein